jgi:hypothetical protein
MYPKHNNLKLDPNNPAKMDAFNERYSEACKQLGISRETMLVTPQQAAEYLGLSVSTLLRYVYQRPEPAIDSESIPDTTSRGKRVMIDLSCIVERKMLVKKYERGKAQ